MSQPQAESPTRSRTRQAILAAAMEVWAVDRTASLADIAVKAGVARTTLHRYFPDRADLVTALARHVMQLLEAAIERARPDVGPPLDALRRLAEEHYDLGPILMELYENLALADDADFWERSETVWQEPLDRIFHRMQDDLRPELSLTWLRHSFWSLLYAGWEVARKQSLPRHEVIDSTLLLFTHGALTSERS